jgi:hypothetical protein
VGGLVVKKVCSVDCPSQKKALIDAHERFKYFTRINGVMFISTPHKETHEEKLFKTLLTVVSQQPNKYVQSSLPNLEFIGEINRTFNQRVEDEKLKLKFASFYEMKELKGHGVCRSRNCVL